MGKGNDIPTSNSRQLANKETFKRQTMLCANSYKVLVTVFPGGKHHFQALTSLLLCLGEVWMTHGAGAREKRTRTRFLLHLPIDLFSHSTNNDSVSQALRTILDTMNTNKIWPGLFFYPGASLSWWRWGGGGMEKHMNNSGDKFRSSQVYRVLHALFHSTFMTSLWSR